MPQLTASLAPSFQETSKVNAAELPDYFRQDGGWKKVLVEGEKKSALRSALACGMEFQYLPDSDWMNVITPGMRNPT